MTEVVEPHTWVEGIPRTLIAYHANCIDGFTSAWVTFNALKDQGTNIAMLPVEYTDKSIAGLFKYMVDDSAITSLYIVDFSLKLEVLDNLLMMFPDLGITMLDHHKTAFEDYAPDIDFTQDAVYDFTSEDNRLVITIDNRESGASLCWKYFYRFQPGIPIPRLVEYVKDYDIWKYEFGDHTRWINKVLKEQEQTLANWQAIYLNLESDVGHQALLAEGKELQAAHDKKVQEIVNTAMPCMLAGESGLAVTCEYQYTSDVGHMLAKLSGTYGAIYRVNLEKGQLEWSLRADDGYDVSAIAREYGGGGHKGAAGFVVEYNRKGLYEP